MPDDPSRSREFGFYLALGGVGFEMVVPIILGSLLDNYLGWNNWLTLAGVVLGFAMAMTHLVVLLRRIEREPKQPPRDKP